MSVLGFGLVVMHGSAGKGRNGQYGVSTTAATLIGAIVECVGAFAGHVGVRVGIASGEGVGSVVSAG